MQRRKNLRACVACVAWLVLLSCAPAAATGGADWRLQCSRFSPFYRSIWKDLLPWQEAGLSAEDMEATQQRYNISTNAAPTFAIVGGQLLVANESLLNTLPW